MNAQHAYQGFAPASSVRSPRDNERNVILTVTRDLKRAQASRDLNYEGYVSAISANRRLWTLLVSDVAHPDNQLPDPVKANILYLGEFVQLHSGEVLRSKASAEPLIDINLAVLRGLGHQGTRK